MAKDQKRLDDLIDNLGQIDDRFIHEAENVTPFTFAGFRKKKRRLIPVLLAAALSCALLLVGAASMLNPPARPAEDPQYSGASADPGQDYSPSGGADVSQGAATTSAPWDSMEPDEVEKGDVLQISLLSLTREQTAALDRVNGDGLFLDGVCRLIWTSGDGRYYAVSITDSDDLRRLGDYLTDPGAILPAHEVEDSGLRFWICTGDGVSATPYLLYGAWGLGTLFDYNPECLPSPDFASFLTDLIQKNLV